MTHNVPIVRVNEEIQGNWICSHYVSNVRVGGENIINMPERNVETSPSNCLPVPTTV